MQNVGFTAWPLSLSSMHFRFPHVFSGLHSCGLALSVCATVCLFIRPRKDLLVTFEFGQLHVLYTSMCRFPCGLRCS